jgi:hypothetical protein
VAEWPNVPDSKSGVAQVTVGSNPTLSAKDITLSSSSTWGFFVYGAGKQTMFLCVHTNGSSFGCS